MPTTSRELLGLKYVELRADGGFERVCGKLFVESLTPTQEALEHRIGRPYIFDYSQVSG